MEQWDARAPVPTGKHQLTQHIKKSRHIPWRLLVCEHWLPLDTKECPVTALVVATKAIVRVAIRERKKLGAAAAALYEAAEPCIDKVVDAATEFHTAWVWSQVLLKTHNGDCD
jgi:hypothetical protein